MNTKQIGYYLAFVTVDEGDYQHNDHLLFTCNSDKVDELWNDKLINWFGEEADEIVRRSNYYTTYYFELGSVASYGPQEIPKDDYDVLKKYFGEDVLT